MSRESCLCFCIILVYLLLSLLATALFLLHIHGLSFGSSERCMKCQQILTNPLQCWYLKGLHFLLGIWNYPPLLSVPQLHHVCCIDKILFSLIGAMSQKSLSNGRIFHYNCGGPPKLLLPEMLCAAAATKKTGLCVDTVGEQTITLNCTCRQTGDLTQHHSLAISDLCNTSLPPGQNHGFASHSPEELEEEETSSVALDSSSHCLQLPHCNM